MLSDGWKAFVFCFLGLLLLVGGAAVPAHLRSVDWDILVAAGRDSPSLVSVAARLQGEGKVGTARLLLETARGFAPDEARDLLARGEDILRSNRPLAPWGGPSPWLNRFAANVVPDPTGRPPAVLEWLLPETVRNALLRPLTASTHPTTMALVGCRQLKETTLFPPVNSASGQPLDAALLLAGALVESGRIHPSLMIEFERAATAALKGQPSTPLESGLLELLAVARYLNWDQLATLAENCEDRATLKALVTGAGANGARWGPLFSAVVLNGGAREVATFLDRNGSNGNDATADLQTALGMGTGAVQELLHRGQPLRREPVRRWVEQRLHLTEAGAALARVAGRAPVFALGLKYLLWADGVFLLVMGLWYARRLTLGDVNRQFEPRPSLPRMAAVTAAVAVLLFLGSERLLNLKSNTAKGAPARPFPVFTARLRPDIALTKTPAMNEKIIAMLVAFFVIQFTMYLVALGRVRHIRGRVVEGAVKLRLLDNEESMFDAPLYIGIGGSVLALVMRLSGFDEVSLMASYSSTLFGILFCFILKVVHVRPYRQRLILESAERKLA